MSNSPPIFTRQQIAYLNSVFPEETTSVDTNVLLHTAGKRTVVKHIESIVERLEVEDNAILHNLRGVR